MAVFPQTNALIRADASFPNTTSPEARPSGLISAETFRLFLTITIPCRLLITTFGMFTNTLNIRAFHRIGLNDSVTIVFIFLAISDFCLLLGAFLTSTLQIFEVLQMEISPTFPVYVYLHLLETFFSGFQEVTYSLTMFLAVQRCLCVVKPLHFKGMFTPNRALAIVAFIWLFSFGFSILHFFYEMSGEYLLDPLSNYTILVLKPDPVRVLVDDIWATMFPIVMNVTNQVVVTVCLFVMTFALKRSAKFRQTTTTTSLSTTMMTASRAPAKQDGGGARQQQKAPPDGGDQSVAGGQTTLADTASANAKEKQVIIQVSLVCAIFVACNFIRLPFVFVSLIEPKFEFLGLFHYIYVMYYLVISCVEYLNSSVNFFVYYNYNTKFRNVCFGNKA